MNDDPLALPVERETSFGKNLLIVLAVHVVLLGGGWMIASWQKKPVEEITWLDGGGGALGAPAAPEEPRESVQASEPEPAEPEPAPEPEPPRDELPPIPPPEPKPPEPEALVEKKTTPPPTPKPKATPAPTPKPKPASPIPKKAVIATPKPKGTPKPAAETARLATPKPGARPATPKPGVVREGTAGSGEANTPARTGTGTATTSGPDRQTLRGNYGGKVGGAFKAVADSRKPLSVPGDNREYAVLMRFRISQDGSVFSATVVAPSGNPLVDDWIRASIPDFRRVPPPPPELLKDGVYEDAMEVIYEL